MQRELEPGDDAEVAAAAAQRPEQVGVLAGAGAAHRAVGADDVRRHQVVDGHPVRPREPAEAAAQRQPGDAGRRVDAERRRQAVLERGPIDVGEERARLDVGAPGRGVDADLPHLRQVDHHAAVAHRRAGDVVAAAADRDLESPLAGEADRRRHVRGVGAAHDDRRPAIDHRVPDGAHGVVGGIAGQDDGALHGGCQRLRVDHASGNVHWSVLGGKGAAYGWPCTWVAGVGWCFGHEAGARDGRVPVDERALDVRAEGPDVQLVERGEPVAVGAADEVRLLAHDHRRRGVVRVPLGWR